MLKLNKEIYSRAIALFFLAGFILAMGKNISCDASTFSFYSGEATEDYGHNHGDVHHHHPHEHSPGGHSHDHDHDATPPLKDNCCKKLAKSLFSGLPKPESKTVLLPVISTTVNGEYRQEISSFSCITPVAGYYSWKAPPPKIPDIRILIHSFLI